MPYHHKSLGMSANGSNFAALNNQKQTKNIKNKQTRL
jgi:hypothetical protein